MGHSLVKKRPEYLVFTKLVAWTENKVVWRGCSTHRLSVGTAANQQSQGYKLLPVK